MRWRCTPWGVLYQHQRAAATNRDWLAAQRARLRLGRERLQQTPPSKLLKFNRSGRQHIEIFAPRSVHRLIMRHSGTALEEPRLVYFILSLLLCAMLALPFPLMWLPRTGLWWVLVVLFVLVALTALLFLAFHLG